MVHLILSSTKGNQGLRYFPQTGYLGLTPVRVEGIVRTKVDADQRTLQAKSITVSVRCYESRVGRVGTTHSNVLVDYTQVLWSKPDTADYEPIAGLEFPFRLTIPTKVAGFSTALFVDYRCVWRVEAVLTHIPITGVGTRQIRHFELPLVRYDVPPLPPPSPPLAQETTKPRAPRIRYTVNSPKTPIGPLDLVSIPIHLQPLDPGVSIRSASVIVERRITFHEIAPQASYSNGAPSASYPHSQRPNPVVTLHPDPYTSSLTGPSLQPSFPNSSATSTPFHELEPPLVPAAASDSTLSFGSSVPTITPGTFYPSAVSLAPTVASETTPLLSASNSAPSTNGLASAATTKVIVNPIAGAESSGSFARDARGQFSKTLTLQWPAAKSQSRWAIGETLASELVSVKYFVRTKIIVTAPSGTESLDLAEQELVVVSTNEAERQLALARWNEAHDAAVAMGGDGAARSKSKSPRRSARDSAAAASAQVPPAPGVPSSSAAAKPAKVSASAMRRPHTSAGPRDRPVNFAGGSYGPPRREEEGTPAQTASAGAVVSSSSGMGISSSNGMNGNGGSSSSKRRADLQQRPDTSQSQRSGTAGGLVSGGKSAHSFWSTVHSNGTGSGASSNGGSRSAGAVLGGGLSSSAKRKDKKGAEKEPPSGSSTSDGGGTTRSTSGSSASSSTSTSSSHHAPAPSPAARPSSSHPANGFSLSHIHAQHPRGRPSTSDPSLGPKGHLHKDDHMREWEEELARIEARSRRSSDLVGFAGKRKRSVGAVGGGVGGGLAPVPVPVPVPVPMVPSGLAMGLSAPSGGTNSFW